MITARDFRLILTSTLALGAGFILWPKFILAATTQGYTFLDPSVFGLNGGQGIDFIGYAKLIYQTILSVVVVMSIIMVAMGGMEYIASGAGGAKSEGKQRITNALIGLLIALTSYLILNTIDPSFVNFKLSLSKIQTVSTPSIPSTGNNPSNSTGGGPSSGGGPTQYPSGTLSEADARNQLAAAGISVNKNPCPDGVPYTSVSGGCTNLGGLSQESINQVINLKQNCNCQVIVTGGTEGGHSPGGFYGAHTPGGTAIDIGRNTSLDNYIQNNGGSPTMSQGRPIYQINGRKYWREDDLHWHSY